jgi:hypothetical protein
MTPGGAAGRVSLAPLSGRCVPPVPHPALLGFEHESVAPVEIDSRRRSTTAPAAADHGALENVVVALVRGVGRIGFRQVERAA